MVAMKKDIQCHECRRKVVLKFPDDFEGHTISSFNQMRDYAKFREWVKKDTSYGCFCWSEGQEIWLCPECNSKRVWLAGGNP